jgi:hypothetical protein
LACDGDTFCCVFNHRIRSGQMAAAADFRAIFAVKRFDKISGL